MKLVHVAVAVITDADGRVLIQKRAADAHQGGLWEFPGGKVESGESLQEALAREINEELNIQVNASRPLICIEHDYGDRKVLLDVHLITQWSGSLRALEGQPLIWAHPDKLVDFDMPAADRPIVNAIQLPDEYLITPPEITDHRSLLNAIENLDTRRRYLLMYRVDKLHTMEHQDLLSLMAAYSHLNIMLHHQHHELLSQNNNTLYGMHFPQNKISEIMIYREAGHVGFTSAACHEANSLQEAKSAGADFVTLSPVKATASHPDANLLGWEQFAELARGINLPVYALGGVGSIDLETSWNNGAQGVAGISYWSSVIGVEANEI